MKPIQFFHAHNRTAQNNTFFIIQHPCIRTRNSKLVIGFEYQLLSGLNLYAVRLNHIRFHRNFMELNLYFLDMDRSLVVTTALANDTMCEWRIFNKDTFSRSTFKVLRRLLGKGDQEDIDIGFDHLLLEFEF